LTNDWVISLLAFLLGGIVICILFVPSAVHQHPSTLSILADGAVGYKDVYSVVYDRSSESIGRQRDLLLFVPEYRMLFQRQKIGDYDSLYHTSHNMLKISAGSAWTLLDKR
jgi:hypothetical protein